jgi:hypothetical protein
MGRAGAVGVGFPRTASRATPWGPPAACVGPGDLVICRLDRQEPRQRRLAGRVGVVRLGQPAIRALDIGEGRPSLEAERAIRIRIEGHGWLALLGSASRAGVAAASRRQPISSPTGASSNSGMDSAPTRPCGSRMVGRW